MTEPAFDNQENYERSYKRMWQEIDELRRDYGEQRERLNGYHDLLLRMEDEVNAGLRLRWETFKALYRAIYGGPAS